MSFAALVLAAGRAQRFGDDKLLQAFEGAPLIAHAIKGARAAPVDRIVIVKRPGAALDAACRAAAMQDARIDFVESDNAAMSDSLRAGLQMAGAAEGVFVFLGDMPLIPPEIPILLAERLGSHFAVLPRHEGQPGHPVLLSKRAAALAQTFSGDSGAGALLRAHAGETLWVDMQDERVIADVDTLADLQRISARDGL